MSAQGHVEGEGAADQRGPGRHAGQAGGPADAAVAGGGAAGVAAAARGQARLPLQDEVQAGEGGARGAALQCGDQAAAVKQEPDPDPATVSSSSGAAARGRQPPASERKYATVQCTGYLQVWPLSTLGADPATALEPALSCLVAVARPQPSYPGPLQVTWPWPAVASLPRPGQAASPRFSSRHSADGKFLLVEAGVTLVLGHHAGDLLGCTLYELLHHDDIPALAQVTCDWWTPGHLTSDWPRPTAACSAAARRWRRRAAGCGQETDGG